MNHAKKVEILSQILKDNNFDILTMPECNSECREHLNNDVLSLFEQKYPEKAYPSCCGDPDYSALDEALFSDLLSDIVGSMSDEALFSIGNVYSHLREHFNNEIIDYYLSLDEHTHVPYELAESLISFGSVVFYDDEQIAIKLTYKLCKDKIIRVMKAKADHVDDDFEAEFEEEFGEEIDEINNNIPCTIVGEL